jgi:hypothetical protein
LFEELVLPPLFFEELPLELPLECELELLPDCEVDAPDEEPLLDDVLFVFDEDDFLYVFVFFFLYVLVVVDVLLLTLLESLIESIVSFSRSSSMLSLGRSRCTNADTTVPQTSANIPTKSTRSILDFVSPFIIYFLPF